MIDLTKCDSLVEFLSAAAEVEAADTSAFGFLESEALARDLTVIASSAAMLQSDDKRRLSQLAIVGDAVLTLVVMEGCAGSDATPQSCQEERSRFSSDLHLGKVFVDSGLSRFVTFVSGVPVSGKSGATALESMIGFIYLHSRADAVEVVKRFLLRVGVLLSAGG